MLYRIGLTLLAIGGSMADSDCLIIPIVITGAGAALLYMGAMEDSEYEDQDRI